MSGKENERWRTHGEEYGWNVSDEQLAQWNGTTGIPGLMGPRHGPGPPSQAVEYKHFSAAELHAQQIETTFLIDDLLVAKQPGVIGGPKKAGKTSIALDLAVSLASGAHFLGRFKVNEAQRVLFMSGESGLGTLQETYRRVCRAARRDPAQIEGLFFSEDLPQFGSLPHMDAIRKIIADLEATVLIVDPMYLCVPPEAAERAGNYFIMGPLLRSIGDVCKEAGCLFLFAAHTKKNLANPYEPPELESLAWSGLQEYVRQWLLIGRRQPYEPGTGQHALWLASGGSAGHGGLWGVDISEGRISDPGGRKWEVDVISGADAREDAAQQQEAGKADKRKAAAAAKVNEMREQVRAAFRTLPEHTGTLTDIATAIPCAANNSVLSRALHAMKVDGELKPTEITKKNKQTYPAFRIVYQDER